MEPEPKKTNWWGIGGIIGLGLVIASGFAPEPPTAAVNGGITPTATATKVIKPIDTSAFEQKTVTPVKTQTPESNCHPSYSGCLKQNVGDYDCTGGSGNGPNYTGPVQVYGSDPFDLDRDNDGWGCE
jgi:hypothetical protein